jgi:hypothetical protein
MAEYRLAKQFDIDRGELDGHSPQNCFVLGYELALIDSRLLHFPSQAIICPVHASNADRIHKSCTESGRKFTLTWPHDDSSEEWMQLEVAPL